MIFMSDYIKVNSLEEEKGDGFILTHGEGCSCLVLNKSVPFSFGTIYEFEVPSPGGGNKTVRIRDDTGGHDFGVGNPQDRGSHFNDEDGNHYDY